MKAGVKEKKVGNTERKGGEQCRSKTTRGTQAGKGAWAANEGNMQ